MGVCPALLLILFVLFPRIHLANNNFYHLLFISFEIIGVIIFMAQRVSLHGLLSPLVMSHYNHLVFSSYQGFNNPKTIFTIVDFSSLVFRFLTPLEWAALSGVPFSILAGKSVNPVSVCMGSLFRIRFKFVYWFNDLGNLLPGQSLWPAYYLQGQLVHHLRIGGFLFLTLLRISSLLYSVGCNCPLLLLLSGVGQQCTFGVIAFGVFLGPHLYWASIL